MKKPLLVLVLLLASLTTWATNFYVSPSGSDNNTGRTVALAFLTLQVCLEIILSNYLLKNIHTI